MARGRHHCSHHRSHLRKCDRSGERPLRRARPLFPLLLYLHRRLTSPPPEPAAKCITHTHTNVTNTRQTHAFTCARCRALPLRCVCVCVYPPCTPFAAAPLHLSASCRSGTCCCCCFLFFFSPLRLPLSVSVWFTCVCCVEDAVLCFVCVCVCCELLVTGSRCIAIAHRTTSASAPSPPPPRTDQLPCRLPRLPHLALFSFLVAPVAPVSCQPPLRFFSASLAGAASLLPSTSGAVRVCVCIRVWPPVVPSVSHLPPPHLLHPHRHRTKRSGTGPPSPTPSLRFHLLCVSLPPLPPVHLVSSSLVFPSHYYCISASPVPTSSAWFSAPFFFFVVSVVFFVFGLPSLPLTPALSLHGASHPAFYLAPLPPSHPPTHSLPLSLSELPCSCCWCV